MEKIRLYHGDGEVMELERVTKSYYRDEESRRSLYIDCFEISICEDGGDSITESLNPTHLEFIEVKECSECGGKGWRYVPYHDSERGNEKKNCHLCVNGKIEVITQWTKFGMGKEKYDKDIWETGHDVGLETGIKLHEPTEEALKEGE